MGKSRLIEHFVDEVEAGGARALVGACLRSSDEGLPFAAFVEILRELVEDTPPERLDGLLGKGRRELGRLLPGLVGSLDVQPPGPDPDRSAATRLFEHVLGVLVRSAVAAPVVLVIEDVQWADRSTRDLLAFLVRAIRDERVLVLLSVRTDARSESTDFDRWLSETERDDHVDRLDVRPFDRDELASQVASLQGAEPEPATVDRLMVRTDGNPFFVEELVRSGPIDDGSALPPVLRDVLSARIGALDPGAHDILRVAAVGGPRVDDGLIAEVLGRPVRELGAGLREALRAGILVRRATPTGSHSAFRHALIREVVLDELFTGERRELHAAFAVALESRASSDPSSVAAADIARHWDAAGRPDRALPAMVEAARAAERVYAYPEALALWERTLGLIAGAPDAAGVGGIDRTTILNHGAEAAVLAGEYDRACELGQAAVETVHAGVDPLLAGQLRERLRWYLWEAGRRAEAEVAVREALAILPVEPPSIGRARALAHLAGIELYANRFEESAQTALAAIDAARTVGAPGEEALALGILGTVLAVGGDVDAGIERLRDGARLAETLGSVEGMALAAMALASLLDRVDRPADVVAATSEGYALAERYGVVRTYGGLLLGFRARAALETGDWPLADRSSELGLRHRPTGRPALWLLIARARLLAGRGDGPGARALLDRARIADERLGQTEYTLARHVAEAEAALHAGSPRAAAEIALSLASDAAGPMVMDPSFGMLVVLGVRGLADLADVGRARADPDAAGALAADADRLVSTLRASPVPVPALLTRLLEAESARLRGRDDAPVWDAAARAAEDAGRPPAAAYARFRQGAAILTGRGDRAVAAEALRVAHVTAAGLGAVPLREAIERLASQARIAIAESAGGSSVSAPASADPEDALGLTSREREVLRLVAGGWSNQQIADELFITRKTASVHVSNILGKLGVGSRVEAAAVAHRIGLGRDAPVPPDVDA